LSFPNYSHQLREEDIKEHWDVSINGNKYDVKDVKKVSRSDIYPNELYHFLEIKNVNGDLGWVYGQANYFAFATNRYFIVVKKEDLQNFIKYNISKIYVDSPDKSLYALYSRKDRKDVISMVTSLDLMHISKMVLFRENNLPKIGESVIPEIRKSERISQLNLNNKI
jgi:hypothetical protein